MPDKITITGTRSTDHRSLGEYDALFTDYLRCFALPGVTVFLGGAHGIDSLALLWLAETESDLVVVVPGTLAGQLADARHAVATVRARGRLSKLIELGHQAHPSAEAYHFRNRWMVDRSGFVIGFPKTSSGGGTWYTLDYAAEQNKPRLILPV